MQFKYLFGPVLSRRLGLSLGVDLVPYKVCSLDCVYCEVGRTNNLTLKRDNYSSIDEILAELDNFLSNNPQLDYITLSGGGEPTLHNQIDKLISFLKNNYPQYKIALITNSTLLWDDTLRFQIQDIDLILPSLDAVSPEIFQTINRHVEGLTADMLINGLIEFRKIFHKPMWLEIFIIPNINDTDEEIEKLKQACIKIKPDIVQLNSLDRPGTESWVQSSSRESLDAIATKLSPLNVEIIAKINYNLQSPLYQKTVMDNIFNLVKLVPCSLEELSSTLSIHINTILKYLSILIKENKIGEIKEDKTNKYYAIIGEVK